MENYSVVVSVDKMDDLTDRKKAALMAYKLDALKVLHLVYKKGSRMEIQSAETTDEHLVRELAHRTEVLLDELMEKQLVVSLVAC